MKGKFGLITFIFLAAGALMYLSFPKTPQIKEITKDINITTR